MKYRQTLIWEFMEKKILRPIDKLKVMLRIKEKLLENDFKSNWVDLADRIYNLIFSISRKLTTCQKKYYSNVLIRFVENDITLEQKLKSIKILFKYYRA